jgi:DNA polymerase epsilon subunit 2
MLTRSEDGSFILEDLDDKVELDLSEASPASGMFTEGCFALLDGFYTKESIFKVHEIGHPPSEKRAVSRCVCFLPTQSVIKVSCIRRCCL